MKVAKIAAIVAGLGIIASILVIRTPAFTTLRIAAKDLVSPSEGVSWMDLSEPTRDGLEKAIARHPGDWKLQLVHARRLYTGGRPWEAGEQPESAAVTMREFEQVIANAPTEAVPRAAYVRWLFQQRWDYLHPTQAEERARTWPGGPVETPHAATRLDLVSAAEGQLTKLAEIEPDNAAWPYLLASCRFARLDDRGALTYLKEAASKPRFSLDHRQELAATVDAYASLGIPRPEASVQIAVQMLFPELADMRNVARTAAALADKMEAEGRLREAAEIRITLIEVGRLMRRDAEYVITGLIGSGVESIGYGKTGMEVEWRSAELGQTRRREESFLRLLSDAGLGASRPRFAHGLEEGLAYRQAAAAFTEKGEGSWEHQFRLLGIAYSTSPLGWFVLAATLGALILVGIISALLRRKGARPSSRTVVGVSVVGGIAGFCLLALSAVPAVFVPYAFGLLDEATGAWRHWYTSLLAVSAPGGAEGLPPSIISSGLGIVVLTSVWGVVLILKPRASRLWRTAFATACSGLAACFWAAAWLGWNSLSRMEALNLGLHIALGVVSVGAIVAIWWTWTRSAHEWGASWIAILATVLVVAAFSVLFLPIDAALNTTWPWLAILLGVAGVTAVAAIVPRLVSIARLPAEERPSYLGILRPALVVCLAWLLVLQFASLIWLATWRRAAAYEVERAHAISENQAVVRIMEETQHDRTAP